MLSSQAPAELSVDLGSQLIKLLRVSVSNLSRFSLLRLKGFALLS